ncbi:MAG: DUF5011 domain-containing protein [Candidatus Micrarchaeia archaeon]
MEQKQPICHDFFKYALSILLLISLSYPADPLTTSGAAANGSAYSFGAWSPSTVSVTLACVAGSSDCANTSYCMDTANACDPTSGGTQYLSPVNISTEGVSYVRYASANSTGGWGDTGSITIRIDSIAPAISISDDASGSWTRNDTISVGVSDGGSGVLNTTWIARPDSACGQSQDGALDSGTNSTSMQADSDSLYQGRYICFRAIDAAGNRNYAVSSQITRLDTTAPTVNSGEDRAANSPFTQNGAASDSGSGLSSHFWSVASGPGSVSFSSQSSQSTALSANTDGTYMITLSATDAAGNTGSDSFTLSWITSAPAITISSPPTSPAQSKIISASVPSGTLTMAVTAGTVCDSTLSFGTYSTLVFSSEADNGKRVCYKVADSAGNTAYLLSGAISGIDTTRPAISLNGNPQVAVEANSNYTDAGATAADSLDGNISSRITVNGTVNTGKVGAYTLKYDVTDAAGNKAAQLVRTVTVADSAKPVITLLGNSTATIEIRTDYVDAGATAFDGYDGDITTRIIANSTVNPETAGTYSVTYDVTDAAGNRADRVSRTVIVADGMLGLIGAAFAAFLAIAALAGIAAYFLFIRKKRGGL